MKHTPGPWTITERNHGELDTWLAIERTGQDTHCGQHVAHICQWGSKDAESDANAKLIAAAPEMLDALKSCKVLLDNDTRGGEVFALYTKITALIDKAS